MFDSLNAWFLLTQDSIDSNKECADDEMKEFRRKSDIEIVEHMFHQIRIYSS